MSTTRDTSRGATRFRSLPHSVRPKHLGVYLGLFADDACMYVADSKEGYILRKLQRGLSAN
jgi:hypothetical protein